MREDVPGASGRRCGQAGRTEVYSVDYDQLRDHGTQLVDLRVEFRGIEDNTSSY